MKSKMIGLIIFWLFTAYMVGVGFIASWWVVPTYRNLSPVQISESIWSNDGLFFILWALSVPVGSVLAGVGLLIFARSKSSRIWLFGVGVILLLVLIGLVPIPGYYPPIFGIGGGLILTLFLVTIWFWAKKRPFLEGSARTAADFQLAGYVFFIVAAWYLCGLLGPPAYLLNPEKVKEFGSLQGAQNQAVNIFIYLIIGWLFTFLSHYKSRKQQG
ncbi:hypothetical protein ACFLWE_00290 [Chloroflexota bacterium]